MRKSVYLFILLFIFQLGQAQNYQRIDCSYGINYTSVNSNGALVMFNTTRMLVYDSELAHKAAVGTPFNKPALCGLFINRDSFFVLTTDWNLYITTDGGKCYDSINKFTKRVTDLRYFNGVICATSFDTSSYVAVLYQSVNFGNSFVGVGLPYYLDNTIFPIYFNKDTIILASNDINSTAIVRRTNNGGLTWTGVYNAPTYYSIHDFDFWDVNNGIVSDDAGLFETSNGGVSWTTLSGLPDYQGKLKFVSADTVLFVTDEYIYISPNKGAAWDTLLKIGSIDDVDADIISINFDEYRHNGFITSLDPITTEVYGGRMLISNNGGYQWRNVNYPVSTYIYYANQIGLVNDTTLFVIPDKLNGEPDRFLLSHDTGQLWSYNDYANLVTGFQQAFFINDSVGFLSGNISNGTNKLLKTTNAAQSWQIVNNSVGTSPVYYMKFFDDSSGYINLTNVYYKTSNGGSTFSPIELNGQVPSQLTFASADTGFAIWNNWIYMTGNGDSTWTPVNATTANNLTSALVATGRNNLFLMNDSLLYFSSDYGASFFLIHTFPRGGLLSENRNHKFPMLYFIPGTLNCYYSINPVSLVIDSFPFPFADETNSILQLNDSTTYFFNYGVITDINKLNRGSNCGFSIQLNATSYIGNCSASAVDTFSVTGGIDSIKSISWYKNGALIASGALLTQQIIPNLRFHDVISVTATNSCGCSQSAQAFLSIEPPNPPVSVRDTSVCKGQGTVLLASGANAYMWSNGLANGDTVHPLANTVYTVTGTDTRGCTATTIDSIIIKPLPMPVFANAPQVMCRGVVGNDLLFLSVSYPAYQWSTGETTATITVHDTGSYTVTVTAVNGCAASDANSVSLDMFNISIICNDTNISCPANPVYLQANGGVSFAWSNGISGTGYNNINVSQPGTYTVTATDGYSCTSTASQRITESPGPDRQLNVTDTTICNGDSVKITITYLALGYSWYVDSNFIESGNNNSFVTNQSGYYNVYVLDSGNCPWPSPIAHVIVTPPTLYSFTDSVCIGNLYNFNGRMLNSPGTYLDTIINGNGCDSIVTLHLIRTFRLRENISASICAGKSYTFGARTLYNPGTYTDTRLSSGGCDTVITLTLQVVPSVQNNISHSICQGEVYQFNGKTFDSTGIYYDTLTASGGCDSIITLTLQVAPSIQSNISHSICQGEVYQFNGKTFDSTGTYYDTLTASGGCDSIVSLTLNVNAQPAVLWPGNADTVLNNQAPVLLSGATPATGVYNGNGVRNNIFYPDSAGHGENIITYTYTDTNGCTATVNKNIFVLVSGVSNLVASTAIQIYPNPTDDLLIAKSDAFISSAIETVIYNATGKAVSVEIQKDRNRIIFDTSVLSSGLYAVRFIVGGIETTKRFVKLH